MSFELGRIYNQDEGIGPHARVVALNHAAGEFLLRRRGNRAVYSGKIYDVEGPPNSGLLLPRSSETVTPGIVRGVEIAAGDGIHERGLAGIRHADETNGQFFSLGLAC